MATPRISVVIVNWNGKQALKKCLKSMEQYENVNKLQIIVSDNDSTDGSNDMLAKEFPYVEVVQNGQNIGFAAGNNRGLIHAKADLVLILNPDMEFIETGLEKLAAFMDANPDVGACGCMALEPDGSFMKQCRRGYPDPVTAFFKVTGIARLFPGNADFGKYFYSGVPNDRPMDVDALSGSFILARRSVMEVVGGFSEEYFMYVEDVDICLKIRRAGYKVRYMPEMKIIHHGSACMNQRRPLEKKRFYHYHMTRSHIVLYARDRQREGRNLFYHISFGLILVRYVLISLLVTYNDKLVPHLAEFRRIHSGKLWGKDK
ncbi:MAG: glycosyltransferase family 2 protein [Nitrospinota bacterium]